MIEERLVFYFDEATFFSISALSQNIFRCLSLIIVLKIAQSNDCAYTELVTQSGNMRESRVPGSLDIHCHLEAFLKSQMYRLHLFSSFSSLQLL